MAVLKTGDPCPCCGQPIKTKNADVLRLLCWIAETRKLPTVLEICELLGNPAAPEPNPEPPRGPNPEPPSVLSPDPEPKTKPKPEPKPEPAKDSPAKRDAALREPCMFNDAILCQGQGSCHQCGWNPDVTEQRCDARSIKLKYARRKRAG